MFAYSSAVKGGVGALASVQTRCLVCLWENGKSDERPDRVTDVP